MSAHRQNYIAGIDITVAGLTVRLSFSLCPEASAPSSADSTAADAFEGGECSPAQALLLSAVAAVPELRAAFQKASSIVLHSQCTLLAQRVDELRADQSNQGGAQ